MKNGLGGVFQGIDCNLVDRVWGTSRPPLPNNTKAGVFRLACIVVIYINKTQYCHRSELARKDYSKRNARQKCGYYSNR